MKPFQETSIFYQFSELVTDRPELLVPTNGQGRIYSREEWAEVRSRVDAFFSEYDDAVINQHNREQYAKIEAERIAKKATPSMPSDKLKGGYIYVLRSEAGHYKIGKAKDPFSRGRTIGTQHAYEVKLIYVALCLDYTRVETYLHQALASYRMNGEWFNLPQDKIDWLLYHDWVDDSGFRGIVTDCERIP